MDLSKPIGNTNVTGRHVLYGLGGVAVLALLRRWYRRRQVVDKLRSRTVMITGCDTGFGRATALQLVKKYQIEVFAACLTENGKEALEKDSGNSRLLTAFIMDVTNEQSVRDAYGVVKEKLNGRGLWALINNAGVLRGGLLECMPIADWKLQMDVNVLGIAITTKTFLPLLRKAKGRIVNIASIAGRLATPGVSGYNASKFAVEGLSDSWRRELRRWGVSVHIVEPGFMKTNLWDAPLSTKVIDQWFDEIDPDEKELYTREYFEHEHQKGVKMVNKMGGDPQQVVDVLMHCVTTRYPATRYNVGSDSHVFINLSLLPTCVGDFFVRLLFRSATPRGLKK